MQAERYAALRELFHELVDLPAAEREERLRALADDDPDLAAGVRELLAVGGEAEEALVGAVSHPEHDEALAGQSLLGRRLGPWQVERPLGAGGMGAVFLAHRADGAFEQKVALKLIRPGLLSGDLVRRFRAEQRTLAALDHPGIARLLDAGATEDGQPWLVLEYVDGLDLEAHCAAHRPDLRARLKLFLAICDAVEHAHRNLVVHRDLKPSNILVTAAGVPKLLDFGIAKLIASAPEEETRLLTRATVTVGTLAFASPEQLRTGAVTTATDVYSLGVILFRLLTGSHPYALAELAIPEVVRIVCEVEPPPPSRAMLADDGGDASTARRRAAALRRDLGGDLDDIVLKALRKDPAERYPSVSALAEDVRRHLDGLPVLARKGSRRYRAGKFIRRNRTAVAAGTIVLLSLLGGLGATLWSARRARQEAARAELERAKATRVSDFLTEMFSSANVGWRVRGSSTVAVGDVLEAASKRLNQDLRDQPEVEARLRHVLGESYTSLLDYKRATPDLERALELDRRLYGTLDLRTARATALLGWVLANAGDLRRGPPLLDVALASYSQLPGATPAELVELHVFRSYAAALEGKGERSLAEANQAVALARVQLRGHLLLPLSMTGLALARGVSGDPTGAEQGYREALRYFDELPDPDVPERRFALVYLATVLGARGELDEPEPLLREALALTERRVGADSTLAVDPHLELGILYVKRGDLEQAERELNKGLAIQLQHTPASHPMVGVAKQYMARLEIARGRPQVAEPLLREALAAFAPYPGMQRVAGLSKHFLSRVLIDQGRLAEAEPIALEAEEASRVNAILPTTHRETLEDLVRLYDRLGRPGERDRWAAKLASLPAQT